MESSRVLARSLQQLQISQQSCLHSQTVTATRRFSTRPRSKTYRTSTRTSLRTFHTSPCSQQDADQPASSTPPSSSQPPSETASRDTIRRMDLSSISSNPDYQPPTRPERDSSPARSPDPSALRGRALSTLDMLVSQERARAKGSQPQNQNQNKSEKPVYNSSIFGRQTRSPTGGFGARTPSQYNAGNMLDDLYMRSSNRDSLSDLKTQEAESPLRLKPSLGRMITVNPGSGMDLTRAFVTLEAKINKNGNSVRRDAKAQKFHVRRGQAKKIKRRERWRIMFKEGFLGECARVRKMIRQGW